VCERTGLAGFLWGSFSDLGWWQVDYSNGDMRPQFDRMAELYATLSNAGLYFMPEAIVAFSNHSCLCLLNEHMVEGYLEGYMYKTVVAFPHSLDGAVEALDKRVLRGEAPIDAMFRAFAHKWVPNSEMWRVPREEWHEDNAAEIKRLHATYRKLRKRMVTRTVLKDGLGVRWDDGSDDCIYFCFRDRPGTDEAYEALTGELVRDTFLKNRVYVVPCRGE
jgi:hypothetical protein